MTQSKTKRISPEHIPLKIKYGTRQAKFTLRGNKTNSVAETFVVQYTISSVIYPTFSGIVIRLWVQNKSHEKKLKIKSNSFTDYHIEGLSMKAQCTCD